MNRSTLYYEAVRLGRAVDAALAECGCVLELKRKSSVRRVVLPQERACFDPQTGLVWVVLNPTLLPRGMTALSLLDGSLCERIALRFQGRVKIDLVDGRIVVMARGRDGDGQRPRVGAQAQSGTTPNYRAPLN